MSKCRGDAWGGKRDLDSCGLGGVAEGTLCGKGVMGYF